MANYSKLDGYVFDKQSNVGWGLTLKMSGKAPAVAKRIFDTLAHAQEYIDDVKDTAIEGLVLSVVADTDTALNGAYFVKSVGKKSDVESGENIKGVLVKLGSEDYTDTEIQKNAKTYSIAKATDEELGELGTNVKEAYKLVENGKNKAGAYIPIYKDSALQSVELVASKPAEGGVGTVQGQFLKFDYLTTNGEHNIVYLDVSLFLAESEFKNGLDVNTNGEVSVKVDDTSETFLTVSDGGIKLSGVQDAINNAITAETQNRTNAINALNATAGTQAVSEGTHVAVQVVETAGKLTSLVVTEDDIASATGLTAEISRAKAAEKVNADAIARLNGDKTVDGSVAKALQDANDYTDAMKITVDQERNNLADIVSEIDVNIANVDKKVNNITVNVESLFTEGNNMTGYTLSDLSKKNLYHSNGNTVKFVGYGNSAINPTINEANLVMESFKDGIRTITIAHIIENVIENGSTITVQSVKTYSSNAFIMKISQSDYETMKAAGTLDENTLYVISEVTQ